jgi:inhibitor of cysteine peptidase
MIYKTFKTRVFYAVILGLLMIFLNGCGDTIAVKHGETFDIALESNPTTGYSWNLLEPINADKLHISASNYTPDKGSLIGAGGKRIITFQTKKRGFATIKLGYLRVWEKGIKPLKERSFRIMIY